MIKDRKRLKIINYILGILFFYLKKNESKDKIQHRNHPHKIFEKEWRQVREMRRKAEKECSAL